MRTTRISVSARVAATAALALATAAGCASTGVVHNANGLNKPTSSLTAPATDQPSTAPTDQASKDFGTPTSDPTSSGDSSYGPAPAASVALAAKFMAYPSGAQTWVKNKTGPFAVDEFVEAFYAEDEWDQDKKLAKQRNLQGAARHGWFNTDDSQTEVWLVKFGASSGASAMYHGLMDSPDLSSGMTKATVSSVGGTEVVDTGTDKLGNQSVSICYTVGDTLVYVTQYSKTADKATAERMAKAQYDKLKGR